MGSFAARSWARAKAVSGNRETFTSIRLVRLTAPISCHSTFCSRSETASATCLGDDAQPTFQLVDRHVFE